MATPFTGTMAMVMVAICRGGVDAATNDRHIYWFDHVVAHSPQPQRLLFELWRQWRGVLDRRWNSKLPLIFPACILRVNPGAVETKNIKQRISQRLEEEALVSQIKSAAIWSARRSRSKPDEESKACRFNSLVLTRKLRSAVRNLTYREGGGVHAASDTCTKTGKNIVTVLVLHTKHPPCRSRRLGRQTASSSRSTSGHQHQT